MIETEGKVAGVRIDFDPSIDWALAWIIDGRGVSLETIFSSQTSPSGIEIAHGSFDEIEMKSREVAKELDVPLLRVNKSLIEQVLDAKDRAADFPFYYAKRRMLKRLGLK